MTTKTPRSTVKDYLQSVDTENEARRVLRRRSVAGDPEEGNSEGTKPGSPSKQQQKKKETHTPRRTRHSFRAVATIEEEEITPRHIIQNMLTAQGTAQPVTRKRKRMSDVIMGPPASAPGHQSVKRHSSLSAVDLDDVTSKHTPRTNIAGFLEQAPEETPAARKSSSAGESHSTSQNASTFLVNEVGVSLLENRSAGASAVVNISASSGRFRGKKGNLNIPLPQVSPAPSPQVQPIPESDGTSRTSTPTKDRTTDGDGHVGEATPEAPPPVSPLPDLVQDGQSAGNTSTNEIRETPADVSDRSETSEGEKSRGSERNIFTDMFREQVNLHTSVGLEDAEADQDATPFKSSQLEMDKLQGGQKARTPSVALSSGAVSENSIHAPLESHGDSGRTESMTGGTSDKPVQSLSRAVSPSVTSQSENACPEVDSNANKTLVASSPVSDDPLPGITSGQDRTSQSTSALAGEGGLYEAPSSAGVRSEARDEPFTDISETGEQLRHDEGSATTRKLSHSSAVSKLSNRLEDRESATSVLRTEAEGAGAGPAEETEEQDVADDLLQTASRHDPAERLSDQESSEGEEYSPLKTPHVPEKQRTPSTAFSKLDARSGDTRQRTSADTRRTGRASQPRRKKSEGLPTSVVKATFTHFCQLRVSKEAIEEVEKMSVQFWKNMAEDLEAYALHAGRKTINESDVELLMKRQGFITDGCSLDKLIAKYLPLELRQELIPIARSGNKLELGSKTL